jgi:predicted N-formylglutamate amidohydrolase
MEIRQDLIGSDAGQQQWAGLLAEYLGRGLDRLDADVVA